jgi:hypothetical protein
MNLEECYKLLEIPPSATGEEITRSFKRLAHRYHPDKNRDRIEWATRAMANLNIAYTTLTSYRFSNPVTDRGPDEREEAPGAGPARREGHDEGFTDEMFIQQFVRFREKAKDGLYRYFQYSLFNLVRRENTLNRGIFNEVVMVLRRSYHNIKRLSGLTRDTELLEHFSVFNEMIFNFYKSSECLNIPDSYSNLMDVEAFRIFKKGDDSLHVAHKEIFYDRHNRGYFRRDISDPLLLKAEYHFREALRAYPASTWAVETMIKLEYVLSLKKYLELFFTGGSG